MMDSERQLLKHCLPAQYRKVVQSRLEGKYSGQYIYMVLNGLRSNNEVMDALVAVARETEAQRKKLRKAVANL